MNLHPGFITKEATFLCSNLSSPRFPWLLDLHICSPMVRVMGSRFPKSSPKRGSSQVVSLNVRNYHLNPIPGHLTSCGCSPTFQFWYCVCPGPSSVIIRLAWVPGMFVLFGYSMMTMIFYSFLLNWGCLKLPL